jgi:hypothetical protein
MTITSITIELHVADAEAMANFLETELGFRRRHSLVEKDGLDWALLGNGNTEIMVHRMLRRPEQRNLQKTIRLYLCTDDVRSLRESLVTHGYAVSELSETDYGATLCDLLGPEGYQFCFQQWKK